MKTMTLLLTVCLLGVSPSMFASQELEKAKENVLAITEQELEKGAISETIAERITALMDAITTFFTFHPSAYSLKPIYINPITIYELDNGCYEAIRDNGETYTACY